jgi:hypothetical protein
MLIDSRTVVLICAGPSLDRLTKAAWAAIGRAAATVSVNGALMARACLRNDVHFTYAAAMDVATGLADFVPGFADAWNRTPSWRVSGYGTAAVAETLVKMVEWWSDAPDEGYVGGSTAMVTGNWLCNPWPDDSAAQREREASAFRAGKPIPPRGFRRLAYVGLDMNLDQGGHAEGAGNHRSGFSRDLVSYRRVCDGWARFLREANRRGIEVVNLTPGTGLRELPRVDVPANWLESPDRCTSIVTRRGVAGFAEEGVPMVRETPGGADPGLLLGTWQNTLADTGQIAGLQIEAVDGRTILRAWGASGTSCLDWGAVPVAELYRSGPDATQAVALEAYFEFGPMSAVIEANASKGLLIVACMKTFRDGSGRSDYFCREFFRRAPGLVPDSLAPPDTGRRPISCADDEPASSPTPGVRRLDSSLFVGRWENTDGASRGLRGVRMEGRDGALLLSFSFADDPDRPCEAVATAFADHPGGMAATQFHTICDRAGVRLLMHGWVKLGVMVIAVFRRPLDPGGPPPWFDREFFYRAEQP